MKKYYHRIFLMISLLASATTYAQTGKPVVDYLHVPGPILFGNSSFQLNWSSHPSDNFYKQEYNIKGEPSDRFKTMILLDVLTGTATIKDIVAMKINELKKLKETNPMVNYEIMDNAKMGEYMLDFLLTANAADGETISIIERNIYRYKTFTDVNGKKGVLLFAVTTRGYDKEVTPFLTALKGNRNVLLQQVAKFAIPQVKISK